MTVAAWIESLQKFDPTREVFLEIEDLPTGDVMTASKPTFSEELRCREAGEEGEEAIFISLTHDDEEVEEVAQAQNLMCYPGSLM